MNSTKWQPRRCPRSWRSLTVTLNNAPSCSSSNHDTTTTDQRPCSADHYLHSPPHPLLIGSSDYQKSYLQVLSQRCRQRDDVERHQCSIHQPCPLLDKHTLILCSIAIYLSSINSSTIHHKKETSSQWICCSAISQLLQIDMHIPMKWLMTDESKMGKKSLTFPVLVPLLWIYETIQGQIILDLYKYGKQSPVVSVHSELNQEGSFKMIVANWNDSSTLTGQ